MTKWEKASQEWEHRRILDNLFSVESVSLDFDGKNDYRIWTSKSKKSRDDVVYIEGKFSEGKTYEESFREDLQKLVDRSDEFLSRPLSQLELNFIEDIIYLIGLEPSPRWKFDLELCRLKKKSAITAKDLQALSETLSVFHVIEPTSLSDPLQKGIFFPDIYEAITVVDGQWFHLCSYGYLRKFEEDEDLIHWLELITETGRSEETLATYLSGRDPKYWVDVMTFWCDYEIPVTQTRTVEILVDLLEDPDLFVFLAAVQVLFICAPTIPWEVPELTGDRMAAIERLRLELT